MKILNTIHGSLLIGFLLASPVFSSSVFAHQVNGLDGKPTHQHVYKRSAYGKGLTVGHYAQPAGSRGIVIWRASPSPGYAKTLPGFRVPLGHAPQPSLKLMFQQKPAFSKYQDRTPRFSKK